jgi:23S rRNA (guanosine2251-2'-O)-methyltransferase
MPQYIGGRHAVLHAIKAGRRKVHAIYLQRGVHGKNIEYLVTEAESRDISVETVSKDFFSHKVPLHTHQGVAARVDEVSFVSIEEILDLASECEKGRILLLDAIEDPQNLGAILRTALSFGINGVIWPKKRCAPLTASAVKAAAGAVEYLPLARVTNLASSLNLLKEAKFWIYGSVVDGGKSIWEEKFLQQSALVIGGEGKGLQRLIRENCDILISIPCKGPLESMNASAAAAVLMSMFCY